jgi:hypothetical protein
VPIALVLLLGYRMTKEVKAHREVLLQLLLICMISSPNRNSLSLTLTASQWARRGHRDRHAVIRLGA